MIITFSTTEVRVHTGEHIYWFEVRLPGNECTTFDVGFTKDGSWVSASKEIFQLEPSLRIKIIDEASKMVANVVEKV